MQRSRSLVSSQVSSWHGLKSISRDSFKDGLTQANAAPSGYYIAQNFPTYPSGFYWIKSSSMPNALQMYVNMTEDGGGYDFYFITSGPSVSSYNSTNGGTALGLDLVYPRTKYHWRAMSSVVANHRPSGTYADYFQTTYGVFGGFAGNYTSTIMRDARNYGSGSLAHQVKDGGKWWLRDSTFGEPNGDYTVGGFFGLQAGGYTFPNPYNLEDIGFNDGGAYSTGNYYLVSTNAKP